MSAVRQGRGRVWSVTEMLDIYGASALMATVLSALEDPDGFRLDLGGAPSIHGSALQILVAMVRAARDRSRPVVLEGISAEVAAVWRLTGSDVELVEIPDAAAGTAT